MNDILCWIWKHTIKLFYFFIVSAGSQAPFTLQLLHYQIIKINKSDLKIEFLKKNMSGQLVKTENNY